MIGQVMLGSRGVRPGNYNASTVPNAPVRVCVANSAVRCKLSGVYWSYSDTPTTGRLTITGGGFNFDIDIRNSGPGYIPFVPPIHATDNTPVCITLYGGGVGVIGSVGVLSASSAVSRSELYYEKVRSYGPYAYWPQWENAGTAAHCIINPAQNGTYVRDASVMGIGAGIGDGSSSLQYDGANDYATIKSPALDAVYDGSEGTMAVWMRVSNAAVWPAADQVPLQLFLGANNQIRFTKSASQIAFIYRAGGVTKQRNHATTTLDWVFLLMTWSATADECISYLNGVQTGPVLNGLGVWAGGPLSASQSLIGAYATGGPNNVFDGHIAHGFLLDRPLGPAEVADLYIVP